MQDLVSHASPPVGGIANTQAFQADRRRGGIAAAEDNVHEHDI